MELIPKTVHAPDLAPAWVNGGPVNLRAQRGKVVLIDFWDYTCVNCLRTLPYLKEWQRRYESMGLVIIGVHAPEFYFARTFEHVAKAVEELGITYPVTLDNDYRIWQSYANKCWPAKYLIDKDGYIRYYQLGEGGYVAFEEALQELLRDANPLLRFPPPMEPVRETDRDGALGRCRIATPELYLGARRARLANPGELEANQLLEFTAGPTLEPGAPELVGWWGIGEECAEAACSRGATSSVRLRFAAAEVNLVAMPPPEGHGTLLLTWNGSPLPPTLRGPDVRETPTGETVADVTAPRMIRLFASPTFMEGLLEISTTHAGLQLFAFTFGTVCE